MKKIVFEETIQLIALKLGDKHGFCYIATDVSLPIKDADTFCEMKLGA